MVSMSLGLVTTFPNKDWYLRFNRCLLLGLAFSNRWSIVRNYSRWWYLISLMDSQHRLSCDCDWCFVVCLSLWGSVFSYSPILCHANWILSLKPVNFSKQCAKTFSTLNPRHKENANGESNTLSLVSIRPNACFKALLFLSPGTHWVFFQWRNVWDTITITLHHRDDADHFSKALGQKTITVTNKGFNSGGSQSGSSTTKNTLDRNRSQQ